MKGWTGFLLLAAGLFFLFLSATFLIGGLASPMDPFMLMTGGVLLALGIALLVLFTILKKGEKAPEVRIEQKVEVRTDDLVAGKRAFQEMKCRSCSGQISPDNVKLSDMGITVTCPYCGASYSVEEEPRW